ncbi:MAG: DUF2851 family protein, partial [Elusimicrobiota bacterium]|nr:DUF2851 family protein [Elusimicrobiota bacterium]
FVLDFTGRKIYQIDLSKFIVGFLSDEDLDGYPYVSSGGKGECSRLASSKCNFLTCLLNSAGEGRIVLKSKKFYSTSYDEVRVEKVEQILYEEIASAIGYKENKLQMAELAKKLPLMTLHQLLDKLPEQERLIRLQALLFGVSGLLVNPSESFDTETKNYILQLEKRWNIYKSKFSSEDIISHNSWDFHRTRPMSFPHRRIAAMSYLTDAFLTAGLLNFILSQRKKLEKKSKLEHLSQTDLNEISEIFVEPPRGYFAYRANFNSKPFSKPQMLIGRERSMTMIVNVLFPFMLYYARTHNDINFEIALCKVYRMLPKVNENRYVKLFLHRLLGDYHRLKIKTERIQQGLLQVFVDFCDSRVWNCKKVLASLFT